MKRMWLLVLLISAACADEIPEDVSAEMEAARAANEAANDTTTPSPDLSELLRTAPAGGYADWVRDISIGLDTVPAMAAVDRGEAQHAVQELYARRFEPLRQFYGTDGAASAGADLARAIDGAGAALQSLTRSLADRTADAAVIEQSVRNAQDALRRIESAAQAAGLSPTAPRDAITTIS